MGAAILQKHLTENHAMTKKIIALFPLMILFCSCTQTKFAASVNTITSNGASSSFSSVSSSYSSISSASSLSSSSSSVAANYGANVMSLSVNGENCVGDTAEINKPCVTVTICQPGTSNCTTISNLLLDTGSFGLRVFRNSSIDALSLPAVTVSGGAGLYQCEAFADSSITWGPVKTASVILGGENAVEVPIQVIDSTAFQGDYTACINSVGTGATVLDTPANAGFNGILGVGSLVSECESDCYTNANNEIYYACSGSTCNGTTVTASQLVQNIIPLLSADNNGIVIDLPAINTTSTPSGETVSLEGYAYLGINTQSNNTVSPSSVKVFASDSQEDIQSTFNGSTLTAFVDTGSNGLFFNYSGIPDCSTVNSSFAGFFCPANNSVVNGLTATILPAAGLGTTTATATFGIGNAVDMYDAGYRVSYLIGGNGGQIFDWGLPFFIGRKVYLGMENKSSSLGTGSYYAF